MGRPRTKPVANPQLAAIIHEMNATYGAIASAVNRVGEENGIDLSCTAASLGKWLNGAVPRPTTATIAVEAFSRLTDWPHLSATDLGWPETATTAPPPDPWRGDPVTQAASLGRDDMLNRRTALTAGIYILSAATVPATLRPPATRRSGPRRAGHSDVARIRAMYKTFGDLDDQFGGGHARTAAAAYYVQEVTPLLHGTIGSARPALFTAAAEIVYLLGWMAADDLRPGLAQRYYIQSVRLADEADDVAMRSTALRSLAVQAVELGHGTQALSLADAAQEGLPPGSSARRRAWVTGMCAEASAAAGCTRTRAGRLLLETERDLERADSAAGAERTGSYHRESFEHQVGLTLAELGDQAGAERHFAASLATRQPGERRTRALVGARLATAQLRQRHPDQAAATILTLHDDLAAIRSARVTAHLAAIRRAWVPFRFDPLVQRADHMLTTLT